MIEELEPKSPRAIGFRLTGKLHDEDYKKFVPIVDHAIDEDGRNRLLAQFQDFEGWDSQALWADVRFAATHCTDFDRIALVGEKQWEEWMATVCKPFTMAKVRYFDAGEIDAAWAWLDEPA